MRSRRIRSEDSRRDVDAVRRAAQQMDKSGVKGPRSGAALGAGRYCASITGDGVARRYFVDAVLHSHFPLVPSSRVRRCPALLPSTASVAGPTRAPHLSSRITFCLAGGA